MNSTRPKPVTVALIHGFSEGRRVSAFFRSALIAQGYVYTHDPTAADVIITHSGGSFVLPGRYRARHIIHINPCYWPGTSLAFAMLRNIADNFRILPQANLRAWLYKMAWNTIYAGNIAVGIRMLKGRSRQDIWQPSTHVTVIRNARDPFCTPDVHTLPFRVPPHIVELPGYHDDLWYNPKPYIAVIQ